jgi:hypothetical protein
LSWNIISEKRFFQLCINTQLVRLRIAAVGGAFGFYSLCALSWQMEKLMMDVDSLFDPTMGGLMILGTGCCNWTFISIVEKWNKDKKEHNGGIYVFLCSRMCDYRFSASGCY